MLLSNKTTFILNIIFAITNLGLFLVSGWAVNLIIGVLCAVMAYLVRNDPKPKIKDE